MIELKKNEAKLKRAVELARKHKIIIPTFKQLKNPKLIPTKIKEKLKHIGLEDINHYNLFRITWKNDPVPNGGLFGNVNLMEVPTELTGVEARIIALLGKWFPTGSHKVGATFGCLVPRLVTGQFDPTQQKAVWPSTGNYCRGGAYVAALLGCDSIAVLPEEMSKERFEWLSSVAGEVIKTPGGESNVKEIFDKCWDLRQERKDVMVFNQFDEFGNYLWHYAITGEAALEVLRKAMSKKERFAGFIASSGSAGTISGCGDFLKETFPESKIAAAEALQCPTLLLNGFGGHRIEGIGDKHVPWIHNVRNTDMVIAVDDNDCLNLIRLCNEPSGKSFLKKQGLSESTINSLHLMGVSSAANLLAAIKFSKYFELTSKDLILTVFTDSMDLYKSRLKELRAQYGKYSELDALKDYNRSLLALNINHMQELNYYDRKRIHNLKYFTWIEQQGRDVDELNAQWYDYPDYWNNIQLKQNYIDNLIDQFNTKASFL
ncbi:MAG: pyridoxal-phosphate dependent enzyme [Candidatus Aminicenantes bacterium]|nr:pyridoxal-phosphate dependent enzyme [Candidatus Aminicenantes bacterium]